MPIMPHVYLVCVSVTLNLLAMDLRVHQTQHKAKKTRLGVNNKKTDKLSVFLSRNFRHKRVVIFQFIIMWGKFTIWKVGTNFWVC